MAATTPTPTRTLAQVLRDLLAAPRRWNEQRKRHRRMRDLNLQAADLTDREVQLRLQLQRLQMVQVAHEDPRQRQMAGILMEEVEHRIGQVNKQRRELRRQMIGLELVA